MKYSAIVGKVQKDPSLTSQYFLLILHKLQQKLESWISSKKEVETCFQTFAKNITVFFV